MSELIVLLSPLYISVMNLLEVVFLWQDFYGALLGAIVAVSIFLLAEWLKARAERRDQVFLLHRSIGAALSNLTGIDVTISDFSDRQLAKIISETEKDIVNLQPTVRYAFVPLLYVSEISEELLKRSSGSGYIDALTIDLVNRSKDLVKILDDINRQFEASIQLNVQIAMSGLNSDPTIQSRAFKLSMEDFQSLMFERDLRNNVRIYALQLIKAQAAVGKLQIWGIGKWKRSFKHFNGNGMYEQMDEYFLEETANRAVLYQVAFRTPICTTIVD